MTPISPRGWGAVGGRFAWAVAILAVAAVIFAGCRGSDGLPYGLAAREVVPSLGFPTGIPQLGDVSIVAAFPALTFDQPIFIGAPADGTDRLFVVEKEGTVRVFDNDDAATTTTLFLSIPVRSDGEQGLLGLAFSPDYATDGFFYVHYTAPTGVRRSVISRFQVSSGDPDVADAGSEEILLELEQPFTNHNAGMLAFGPDGYLYIAFGDGGAGGDPFGHGQDRTTLHGNILRIDPDGGTPYGIPADNPFVGEGGGVREEIYAYGLRNPWRFSFDRLTGDLWVGDVGQGDREEIDLVDSGDNLGWDLFEGIFPFENPTGEEPPDYRPPLIDYGHDVGTSVTGGYVYRGPTVAGLDGVYVYADFTTGRVWGLVQAGGTVIENEQIGTVPNITSFGEAEDGELFAVTYGGQVYRFVDVTPPPPPPPTPALLSETGIFADLDTLEPAPGVIEYEVQVEEWADGARLRRWIFLPGISTIGFDAFLPWEFPIGTVLVKHFEIDLADDTVRRLETRVMIREAAQWRFHLYRWNGTGTDADLDDDGHDETLTVATGTGPLTFDWRSPTAAECAICHTPAAGVVLGVHTRQIHRDHAFPLAVDNQLRTWNHIGLFTPGIGNHRQYEVFPDPTAFDTTLEERARLYLEVNCSSCHRPGGSAPGSMDLRYDTDTADLQVIGVPPTAGDLGIPGALLVAPGDRTSSILHERVQRLDATRMPPVSRRVDEVGRETLGIWIDLLPPGP